MDQTHVVTREIAEKEVSNWLDAKRVRGRVRESHKEYIEALTEAIMEGNIIMNEDNTITQKLLFPLVNKEGITTVSELKYKLRLTVEETQVKMQSVSGNDRYGLIIAFVSALTEKNASIIKAMDTGDFGICSAIAAFSFPQ